MFNRRRNRLFYLARSFHPIDKGGGALIRAGAVKYLKEIGWEVTVVLPNYTSRSLLVNESIIQIPFEKIHIQKLTTILERIGYYEDYLDKWLDNAYKYLVNNIHHDDIVLSTSGGELGMIKLGALLKDKIGCKHVANFHDPLNYGYMDNGLRRDKKPHVGRAPVQYKYIKDADAIITSSNKYKQILQNGFNEISNKIHNNYFGYIDDFDSLVRVRKDNSNLAIAYVGAMSHTQGPEILFEAVSGIDAGVNLYFIGDYKSYRPLSAIDCQNVHFIDYMQRDDLLSFMSAHIDVGFVSLAHEYYGACVPSKIYEYINMCLPMLGALPDGDASKIINSNNYGVSVEYGDIEGLRRAILSLNNNTKLEAVRANLMADKKKWHMRSLIAELDDILVDL